MAATDKMAYVKQAQTAFLRLPMAPDAATAESIYLSLVGDLYFNPKNFVADSDQFDFLSECYPQELSIA